MDRESGRLTDGWVELSAGMDSSKAPNIIPRNAYAFGINCTARGAFPGTRPGYIKQTLIFTSDAARDAFEDGLLQGAGYFKPESGAPVLICSISGRIWEIDEQYNTRELTGADINNPNRLRTWMVQAEGYFIIQDGESAPFIYDGAVLRRATTGEVPTGTVMAYGHERLVVARGREIFIGDINGGATNVITFSEIGNLSLGGTYTVAFPGQITALAFMPVYDTSTGQGPLTVHTPKGVSTLNLSAPRDTWRTIEFQKTVFQPYGSVSQESTLLVNADLWFRSRDGIRSLRASVRDNTVSWSNTPMSQEMDRVLKYETRSLIQFCQGTLFDNRAIFAVSPRKVASATAFSGLAVIDFNSVSNLNQKSSPVWDGLWTGLAITKIVVGEYNDTERCFLFALDSSNNNKLWELSYDEAFDKDGTVRIQSSIESAAYFWENPRHRHKLDGFELFVDQLEGTVNFDFKYRPDQSPVWYDYKSLSVCATIRDCSPTDGCHVPRHLKRQYRSRLWAGTPPSICETGQKKPSKEGYNFSIRVAWTGKARLKMGFLHQLPIQEPAYGECIGTEACEAIDSCEPDPWTYNADA